MGKTKNIVEKIHKSKFSNVKNEEKEEENKSKYLLVNINPYEGYRIYRSMISKRII